MRRRGKKKIKERFDRSVFVHEVQFISRYLLISIPLFLKKKLDKNFNHYLTFPEHVLHIYDDFSIFDD